MPKKKFNTTDITNELQSSVFFPSHKPDVTHEQKTEPRSPIDQQKETLEKNPSSDTVIPRYHDTMTPRYHDTTIPVNSSEEEMVEHVRKIVKQVGKEPATQRLTMNEKQDLAEIEYIYKKKGIKTNGNEIIRISTSYIVQEFKNNGEKSILAKILEKLNS